MGGSFPTNYKYEDKGLIPGTDHYYRLKILNQDGKHEYSNIKFVSMPNTEYNMEIMPNPAGATFQIRLNMETSEILYLEMYDVQGRIIAQKKSEILEGNSIWEIETEGIQNGNYLLRLISSQRIISKKIAIVR